MVTQLGAKADPDKDTVTLDGKPIGSAQKHVYVLLNKPIGYTSTRFDPHAKKTVLELVKGVDAFLYPVGRLDVDTSGLLILTNDGDFTKLLTHPSHEIEKTYAAVVRGRIPAAALRQLEKGVQLDGGLTAPARARLLGFRAAAGESTVELVIHEGRKRQVRRMFAAVGYPVIRLTRTRIGELELGSLKEGEYRFITSREVARLVKQASTSPSPRSSPVTAHES